MSKVHIVTEQKASARTFCGLRAIQIAPFNVRVQHVGIVKEEYICKKCLRIHKTKEASHEV